MGGPSRDKQPNWAAIAAGYNPRVRIELERQEAQRYRDRVMDRRAGRKVEPPSPLPPREKPAADGQTWICIGDSHATPEHPNHRYEWLGRMIVDIQPDLVWDAGDWWDFSSLSSYDEAKRLTFDGRRYWRDVDAGIDAMERMQLQLDTHNRGRRKKYKPRMVRTLGNHEARVEKVIQYEPRFDGIIGISDLMSSEFGWEEHPFLEPVTIEGVSLCHYFTTGVMGRPIGGEHPATTLLKKQFHSCLQGHSHVLDYADRSNATGCSMVAMHVGCYFDYDFSWAGWQPNRMYRRGILVLRNVKDGSFDPEWWSIERVQARYG